MCAPPMVGRSVGHERCVGKMHRAPLNWPESHSLGERGQGMLIDEVSSSIAEQSDRECVAAHHQEEEGDVLRFLKPSRWLSSPCSRSSL